MRPWKILGLMLAVGMLGGGGWALAQSSDEIDLGARRPSVRSDQGKAPPVRLDNRFRIAPHRDPAVGPAGDTIADAIAIMALPFADSGETCTHLDDYDAACDYPATAPDLVYAYTAPAAIRLEIDLCGSAYDTKLFVLDAGLNILACNEDFYPPNDPCGGYVSRLKGVPVAAGQTVYIVVDGYATGCGIYQIAVSEFVPCEIPCTPGLVEGEPTLHDNYVDRFNGGCNSPGGQPPVTTLQGDEYGVVVFCGKSGFYTTGGEDHRDTDWFAITLGETGEAIWQLDAGQATLGYVLALDCPDPDVYGLLVGGPCQDGGLTIVGAPGQCVGLWVAPTVYSAPLDMLGHEYDYRFTLSGLSPHAPVAVEAASWGKVKSLYR